MIWPPNNFWCFSRSPPALHVFIFQANLSGSLSESFQSFQWSPLLGFQLQTDPPFVLPKLKWSPLKLSAPPPQPPLAINNDRSLRTQNIHVDSFSIPAKIYRMHAWVLRLIVFWYRRDPERLLWRPFIATSNKATLTYDWKFFTSDRSWLVLWMESMAQQVIPRVLSLDYFGAR